MQDSKFVCLSSLRCHYQAQSPLVTSPFHTEIAQHLILDTDPHIYCFECLGVQHVADYVKRPPPCTVCPALPFLSFLPFLTLNWSQRRARRKWTPMSTSHLFQLLCHLSSHQLKPSCLNRRHSGGWSCPNAAGVVGWWKATSLQHDIGMLAQSDKISPPQPNAPQYTTKSEFPDHKISHNNNLIQGVVTAAAHIVSCLTAIP